MATQMIFAAVLLLLLALANGAAAQDMKSCPAKYRYQWFYQLTDPNPENLKKLDAVVMKWMREDCDKVLTFGQGPTITSKPAAFGIAAASPTTEFADYGAWSDWASLDDLKSCYEKGIKSGNSPAARKFAKKASRVVYELATCPTTSTAPFAVRFMFNYKMADFTPANCKKAVELNNQITAAQGATRQSSGCDSFNNDATAYSGPGSAVPVTANYGGFIDFKNEQAMTDFLASKDAKVQPLIKEIRGLASSSIRVAVALPAMAYTGSGAKVAKERGSMP